MSRTQRRAVKGLRRPQQCGACERYINKGQPATRLSLPPGCDPYFGETWVVMYLHPTPDCDHNGGLSNGGLS